MCSFCKSHNNKYFFKKNRVNDFNVNVLKKYNDNTPLGLSREFFCNPFFKARVGKQFKSNLRKKNNKEGCIEENLLIYKKKS
jgi:hypothetical protein